MNFENIKSSLELEKLYFDKIEFRRAEEIPEKVDTDFDVKFTYKGKLKVKTNLICKVTSDGSFGLKVSIVGEFSMSGGNGYTDEERKEIFEKNTTAILFPYLRSEMTLLTAQPNMPVLNIPPININAFFEEKKKQKNKESNKEKGV